MAKFHGKHYYLGAWAYVLLDILYAIPVVGLICLIGHSFNDEDENRFHYARSHFARLLLMLILLLVFAGAMYLYLGGDAFSAKISEIMSYIQQLIKR